MVTLRYTVKYQVLWKRLAAIDKGVPFPPFSFNIVMDELMEGSLGLHDVGVELAIGEKLRDLYCTSDISCSLESTGVCESQVVCAGLQHLWRRPNISLKL